MKISNIKYYLLLLIISVLQLTQVSDGQTLTDATNKHTIAAFISRCKITAGGFSFYFCNMIHGIMVQIWLFLDMEQEFPLFCYVTPVGCSSCCDFTTVQLALCLCGRQCHWRQQTALAWSSCPGISALRLLYYCWQLWSCSNQIQKSDFSLSLF